MTVTGVRVRLEIASLYMYITSQQRARMDHLIGEQRATRARGAEGGLFAETPAGLMMPRIICTIITGRPAASAAWGWDNHG